MVLHFSLQHMEAAAKQFWDVAGKSKVFAFHGAMASGKTTIITALCRSLGVHDVIGSPTYSIINEYSYPSKEGEKVIYHMDLYRLKDEVEVIQAGVEDSLSSGSICMVEWPEKAPGLFGPSTVHVYIIPVSDNERSVEVKLPSHV